ncbi:MAG: hydroxymethylbilane synthase [Chitinophagales bacterium]
MIVGSRGSTLALWQAHRVCDGLGLDHKAVRVIQTAGDKDTSTALHSFGSVGVFTKALDDALLNGEIDLAVHSLKDYPTQPPENLVLVACLRRDDHRDVFIPGSQGNGDVLTGSPRRARQWKQRYPESRIAELRGNMDTRLKKCRDSAGGILSKSGLERIDLLPEDAEVLEWMVPAPGQGCVAVVMRKDHPQCEVIRQKLNHLQTETCVSIERSSMRAIEAGCSVPLGIEVKHDDLRYAIRGIRFIEGKNKAFQFQSFMDSNQAEEAIVQSVVQALAPDENRGKKKLLYGREPSEFVRDFLEHNAVDVDFVRTLSAEGIVSDTPINVDGKSLIITSRYALGPAMDQMMGSPKEILCIDGPSKLILEREYAHLPLSVYPDSESIAKALKSSQSYVFFAGAHRMPFIEQYASQNAIDLTVVTAYQTVLREPVVDPSIVYDGVVALSPRSIQSLLKNNVHLLKDNPSIPMYCLGRETALAAWKHGFRTIYFPNDGPKIQSLLDILITTI